MSTLVNLRIGLDGDCRAAAADSLSAVAQVLRSLDCAVDYRFEPVGGALVGLDHLVNLFRGEPIRLAASGAGEFEGLKLHPGDAYREFCTALAVQADLDLIVRHGWPILSLVSDNASVAEAGGAASPAGGGQAA